MNAYPESLGKKRLVNQILAGLIIVILLFQPLPVNGLLSDLRAKVDYVAEIFEENGLVLLKFNVSLYNPTSKEIQLENLLLRIPALSGELIKVDVLYEGLKPGYSVDLRRNLSVVLNLKDVVSPGEAREAFIRILYLGSAEMIEPEHYLIILPKYPTLNCWVEEVRSKIYVPAGSLVTKPENYTEVGTATEHLIESNFTNIGLREAPESIKLWINKSKIRVVKGYLNREVVINEYGEVSVKDEVLVMNVGGEELKSIWYVKGNSEDFKAETILKRTLKHDYRGELIRVELPRPLKSGEQDKIVVRFRVKLNSSKSGLFVLNLSGNLNLIEFPFLLIDNGSISVSDFRGNQMFYEALEKHYPKDSVTISFQMNVELFEYTGKWIRLFALSFLILLLSSTLYFRRGVEKYFELRAHDEKIRKLINEFISNVSSYLDISERFIEKRIKLKSFINSSSKTYECIVKTFKSLKSSLKELKKKGLEEIAVELDERVSECMKYLNELRDLENRMVRGRLHIKEYVYDRDVLEVKCLTVLRFLKKVLKAISS